jgi:hypothetical protein
MALAEPTGAQTGDDFGDRIELLFDRLHGDDFVVGQRERIAVVRYCARMSADIARMPPRRLYGSLLPILAKSPEQAEKFRAHFDVAFRGWNSESWVALQRYTSFGDETRHTPGGREATAGTAQPQESRTWIYWAVFIALLFSMLLLAYTTGLFDTPTQEPDPDKIEEVEEADRTVENSSEVDIKNGDPTGDNGSVGDIRSLSHTQITALIVRVRIAFAAIEDPTIRQFSLLLAPQSVSPHPSSHYLRLLVDHLGLHPEHLLELNSSDDLETILRAVVWIEYGGWTLRAEDIASAAEAAGVPGDEAVEQILLEAQQNALPPVGHSIAWWFVLIVAALPLPWAVRWLMGRRERRKAYLRRRPPKVTPVIQKLVVRSSSASSRELLAMTRSAQRMSNRRHELEWELDIERTAVKTAEGAGLFQPVYRRRAIDTTYLFIIATRGEIVLSSQEEHGREMIERAKDHDAARLDRLVGALASSGVELDRYFMAGDTNLFFSRPGGRYYTLSDLASRHPYHALIFLGQGDAFLNPATMNPWPWSQDVDAWEERAVLTPAPLEEWGRREFSLSRLFNWPIGRASTEGFMRLASYIERGYASDPERLVLQPHTERPSWVSNSKRWLMPGRVDEETWEMLRRELMAYFSCRAGELDKAAYLWLCACAVYPAVRWDLTNYLGLSLQEGGDGQASAGTPIYTEERALRLAQLPWFREGYMPDWFRRRLIDDLTDSDRKHVGFLLEDILNRAQMFDERDVDSIKLQIALDRPDPNSDRPLTDEVFLDFVAQEDVLTPQAPLDLLERLAALPDRFGIQERASMAMFTFYYIALLILIPWPGDGSLTTLSWVPVACMFLVFPAIWCAKMLVSIMRTRTAMHRST